MGTIVDEVRWKELVDWFNDLRPGWDRDEAERWAVQLLHLLKGRVDPIGDLLTWVKHDED